MHQDAESEALVQEALDRAVVGRSVVMIAHRLSTVLGADVVMVVVGGRVVEQGTHAQLVANGAVEMACAWCTTLPRHLLVYYLLVSRLLVLKIAPTA